MTRAAARRLAPWLLVGSTACIPRITGQPTAVDEVTFGSASFRIHHVPGDSGSARLVAAALRRALPAVERWGGLAVPVAITIHPSHEALERAIHREGFGWLRAWARYDTVDLQSPRTWSLIGASEAEVARLLAHELTHCAMYQASGTRSTWARIRIPLWFREGMASVSAGQANHRASREALRDYYRSAGLRSGGEPRLDAVGGAAGQTGRAGDPVSDPEPLYQGDSEVVYAAAHWAFQFLLDRYGESPVREVLAAMRRGEPFDTAFTAAVGIPPAAFEDDFKRYILWHGFR